MNIHNQPRTIYFARVSRIGSVMMTVLTIDANFGSLDNPLSNTRIKPIPISPRRDGNTPNVSKPPSCLVENKSPKNVGNVMKILARPS
jgi:hypothetical protein